MSFYDLGLSPKVLEAIEAAGYDKPTPIQEQAIPIAVQGKDVLGIAQTGTGKTASFVLPMLTRLERGRARARMPRSLILAPTRELAAQVAESFEILGKNHKLTVALLIGGVSFDEQNKKLDRGADVLIATPGRLLDHLGRGRLLLTGIQILVIDEADRMLDMGFIPDIEQICKRLPFTRQTLFFSATMPKEIQRLVDNFLQAPARIEVSRPATAAGTITQKFKYCASSEAKEKREALRALIESEDVKNAILFCNRKRDVAILHRSLLKHGYNAGALHGDMDQHQRMSTLDDFRSGKITMLAASDVAARGLDIPEVSHVFNYDVPRQAEDYIHRIGRTGRAGRSGSASTLVTREDLKQLKLIEKQSVDEIVWIGDPPSAQSGKKDAATKESERKGRKKSTSSSSKSKDKAKAPADKKKRKSASTTDKAEAATSDIPAKSASASKGKSSKARSTKDNTAAKPPKKSAPKDNSVNQGKSGRNDKQPRGMGDHVPAFMTRTIRSSR